MGLEDISKTAVIKKLNMGANQRERQNKMRNKISILTNPIGYISVEIIFMIKTVSILTNGPSVPQ